MSEAEAAHIYRKLAANVVTYAQIAEVGVLA